MDYKLSSTNTPYIMELYGRVIYSIYIYKDYNEFPIIIYL